MKGETLKQIRQSRGLSRAELGDEFGVSEHTVAKWEQNKNPIPRAVERLMGESIPAGRYTPEQYERLCKEKKLGETIEDTIIRLVIKGLGVLIATLALFHVTRSPRNWSAGALKQTVVAAVSWSSAQLNSIHQK